MIKHIKLKIKIILCLALLSGFAFAQDQALEAQFQKALETDVQKRDLSWITSEQRAILIQQAKSNLSSPVVSIKTSARKQLAALEDETTLQQLANEAKTGDGLSLNILLNYGDESALKYLIETVYNGSTEIAGGEGDTTEISETDLAVLGVLRIIARSKSFPDATRDWAKQIARRASSTMVGLGPQGSASKSIRLWWEHNKEVVLSRQYNKATWLPPASEQVSDNPAFNTATASSDPHSPMACFQKAKRMKDERRHGVRRGNQDAQNT